MATVDRYVDIAKYRSDGTLISPPLHPAKTGLPVFVMTETFLTISGNDGASVLRLFKDVPGNIIPIRFELMTAGVTSMSDVDVGLYLPYVGGVAGAVKIANCLADALDFDDAITHGSPLDGLAALDIADIGAKRLFELAGDAVGIPTTRVPAYDIALTLDGGSCGSAARITGMLWYSNG